jgi:hypothetical protein
VNQLRVEIIAFLERTNQAGCTNGRFRYCQSAETEYYTHLV